MAVYRSDQAQLTYAVEAAPGGYPELATTASLTGSRTIAVRNVLAGAKSIELNGVDAGMVAGGFINIGGGTTTNEREIRRIEHAEGNVLYLDAPVAFFHAIGVVVQVIGSTITAALATTGGRLINLIPGVYETVDVPDPTMALEGRYFLGTQSKRNFFAAYKGQQSFVGSVPGFVLLDGRALRFPIGKVVTEIDSQNASTLLGGVNINNSANGAKKGDIFVPAVSGSSGSIAEGTLLVFGNTNSINSAGTDVMEVRKEVLGTASGTSHILQLDYPLQYDHPHNDAILTTAASSRYKHHIFESVELPTVSWHVHMRDSGETAANDFDRRYYGGKIGGATLAADEGGMLTMSWDGVNFMGMVHNQRLGGIQAGTTNTTDHPPFYSLMQSITSTDISFPTSEPYYFSEGSVKIFGETVARVRSFALSIANNEEPRYYIQRRYGRQRGPTEIMEQRREYSLAVTLALPDSTASATDSNTLFKELLWEGDYTSAGVEGGMRGFNIELRFDRGANDSIIIRIPNDYDGSTESGGAGTGGNNQGAFIRTAAHAITGDNPMQVDADVFFRNLKIEITDPTNHYYP